MPNNGIPYIRITMADTSALALVDADSSPVFSDCMIEVAGNGKYSDLATRAAQIRLRGNSTRLWYDKKPYRIKFNVKTEVLGLPANRDWVLLANFRDPTHLMNAVAFDMARHMGSFNFVNANRFVEVEINGDYKGMYQLTEQIEQATSRVNVDVNTGTLLSLDADDGPELSPNASNNFWSSTYKLPVAVKYPKSPSTGTLELIKADFNKLEQAIAAADYATVQALLDVNSFIDFLILQEVTRNVELEAPRSMYLRLQLQLGRRHQAIFQEHKLHLDTGQRQPQHEPVQLHCRKSKRLGLVQHEQFRRQRRVRRLGQQWRFWGQLLGRLGSLGILHEPLLKRRIFECFQNPVERPCPRPPRKCIEIHRHLRHRVQRRHGQRQCPLAMAKRKAQYGQEPLGGHRRSQKLAHPAL